MADSVFDVEINGDIRQPHRVSQFTLDEVRLAAASEYLSNSRKLTKTEREYWQNAARKTDVKNFTPPGRGRR
jgi:histidinol-phosphate/aromatic aminotransferase/cobyric acid decarboxylase-like protein